LQVPTEGRREGGYDMRKLGWVLAAIGAVGVLGLIAVTPDIKRYIRIRSM
jgi:hypothetical protein